MGGDTHGVDVTPEMIKQLIDEGLVEYETDDGDHIVLMYNTIPAHMSKGRNE